MQRIGRARFEVELRVPSARRIVFGVNEKRANADDIGRLGGPNDRISQQHQPNPLALMRSINCKACQQKNWDLMFR